MKSSIALAVVTVPTVLAPSSGVGRFPKLVRGGREILTAHKTGAVMSAEFHPGPKLLIKIAGVDLGRFAATADASGGEFRHQRRPRTASSISSNRSPMEFSFFASP